ncbi:MAG: hypothetical protein JSV80_10595 [Acidobacteriota bacterium]|nr:MAG: hypothetical protein JSV80_10595 [Acidobacteriota bacterium]
MRYRWFFNSLDLAIPRQIVLMPLSGERPWTAVFYGNAGAAPIPGELEDYRRALDKLALGFELLAHNASLRAL